METRKGRWKAGLIGIALFLSGGLAIGTSMAVPSGQAPATGDLNAVLNGSYTCTYSVIQYLQGGGGPDPTTIAFAETTDNLNMSLTGGVVPGSSAPPGILSGGGGSGIGPGGSIVTVPPLSGFGTGHSFNEGSTEDCVRFAQTISNAAKGMGCTVSDVRRKEPPPLGIVYNTASFSFVCEGAHGSLIHAIGELSRAVMGLKLQSAP